MPFGVKVEDVSGWEDRVEQAWREFRTSLADRVVGASTDSIIVLVQVGAPQRALSLTHRGGSLFATVTTPADGSPDASAVFERPSAWVDLLVADAIKEIREKWNVPHPSFLKERTSARQPIDPFAAVSVTTVAELDSLVGRIMSESYGNEAVQESDGTVSVCVGSITAYLYAPGENEVRIHATLVKDIAGRTRAAEVLGDLNRRWPSIKFLLVDDRIHAATTVPAQPLVPVHLVRAFHSFTGLLRTIDDTFAATFSGVAPGPERPADIDESPADDDLPAQLLSLLDMDAVAQAPLDPDVVAATCGRDRTTIAEYARFCAEQASAWRDCADEARPSDASRADECEAEAVPWDRVLRALRAALRAVDSSDRA